MKQIDKLLDAIRVFKEKHKTWPDVKISQGFYDKYAHQITVVAKMGVDIQVAENLKDEDSFILDVPQDLYPTLKTVNDLKKEVDRLVAEGKGNWPVKYQPDDAMVYLDIKLCPIVPGNEPFVWFEHKPDYAGAPEAEHVLVLVGEEDKNLEK